MAQMNLSTEQKQTHRHRKQTYDCQGREGAWSGMDRGFGVDRYKLFTFRMDKQWGPYHTAQGTISNLLGQNMMEDNMSKRVCVYIYICIYEWLSHYAVQQKLTQYCKYYTLLKIKFFKREKKEKWEQEYPLGRSQWNTLHAGFSLGLGLYEILTEDFDTL